MADILETLVCTLPPVATYDSYAPSHTATWLATTKIITTGDHVLALAQGLIAGGLPADAMPVPKYGDRLFWADDEPKADTGQTAADFITAFPLGYADGAAVALDFDVSLGIDRHQWDITVTWRKPNVGMDQSAPRRAAFRNPTTGQPRLSTEDGANQAIAIAAREYWLEYRTESYFEDQAYRVTAGTIAGVKATMQTPAGESYPRIELSRPYVVQVISRLVSDTRVALDEMKAFELTTNDAAVVFGIFTADKNTVHFESSRTGRQKETAAGTYYDLETRLILYREPRVFNRPAVGHWFLNAGQREVVRDFDGNSLAELPLKADGTVALILPAEQAIDTYSLVKEADYSGFGF